MSVGSQSDNGEEFHSFGAQAAKLRGPKVEVPQASTCKSPRAAERKWRQLVLAVTGTHSSWRYSGAVSCKCTPEGKSAPRRAGTKFLSGGRECSV